MGKRENQRKEFDTLKLMFPTDHTQLSVISARVDEVQIQFKGKVFCRRAWWQIFATSVNIYCSFPI